MRIFAYVSAEDIKTLQEQDVPGLISSPPTDFIATSIQEAGNINVDDSDDVLLIDPQEVSGWATIVTYALYSRQIPVYVVGTEDDIANKSSRALTQNPCLQVGPSTGLIRFVTDFPGKGVLVSFEGGDGAGKQTQTKLMVDALRAAGHVVHTLDFPHDSAFCGKLIRKVLRGDCGNMREVDPLLFASLYGMNRFDFQSTLRYWLRRGHIVVLDRYVEANYGHQASKLKEDTDRHRLINALGKFEHSWLGLPESHLVMYLDLPPEVAFRAMKSDTTRAELDMHEKAGIEYKERVRQTFLWCSREFSKWRVVRSMDQGDSERRRSREEIHAEALGYVQEAIAKVREDLSEKLI